MQDIAQNSTLISGNSLADLKQVVHDEVQKSSLSDSLMVHAVQKVHFAAPTSIALSHPVKTPTFFPSKVAKLIGK